MSVEEFAALLAVEPKDVLSEARAGRLLIVSVGRHHRVVGESWSVLLEGLRAKIPDEAEPAPHTDTPAEACGLGSGWSLVGTADSDGFEHVWPDASTETYGAVRALEIASEGKRRHLLIGRCTRFAAGEERLRVVVFLRQGGSRYPLCEFVGGNEGSEARKIAAVIKVEGQQVQDRAAIPAALAGLDVAPYRSVVDGPYASHALAVICDEDDVRGMATYGVFRAAEKALLD